MDGWRKERGCCKTIKRVGGNNVQGSTVCDSQSKMDSLKVNNNNLTFRSADWRKKVAWLHRITM